MNNTLRKFPIFSQETTLILVRKELMKNYDRMKLVGSVVENIEDEELRKDLLGSVELLETTIGIMIETIIREKK